jgi:hypothetical protein
MRYAAAFLALMLAWLCPASAAAQTSSDQSTDVVPSDTSRLFIGPTGRLLAPGQGYVSFDGIFMATVQVGVTRRFSMGAGTPLLPYGGPHPFWITPKVQVYDGDRVAVAAGLMNVFMPGVGTVGMAYSAGTIGTLEASATIGGGVFYADENGPRGGSGVTPVVLAGGERRFRPRVSFLTENYLGAHGGLLSAGVRWRGPAWQVNLAPMLAFGGDWAFPAIFFSFAYKFGGGSR